MANQHIDIERMIMQARYAMQLEAEASSVKGGQLSDMERDYNTMHADICVIHDCDLEKLKEMGLEFIRYTRPVDQFDRVSVTRQDRYLYVWVRDKHGNEFPIFVPKSREDEKRECVFVNESKYDTPCLVPHTSATYIETCKLQKKAALDFFNDFFRSVTEGRSDYELIAQEALG